MKIGFIGLGNMATAMIGGMLQKGIAKPEDIIGSSKTETTAEKVKTKFNINTTTDNTAVAEQADILFLAVKPIFFPEVIAEIKDAVKARYPDRQHRSRQESTVSEGCIWQTGA